MLLPMFCMVVLTTVIILAMAFVRVRSVRLGQVPGRYYRLMSGCEVPDHIVQFNRQVANLFETPMLFYTAGILHVALQTASRTAVIAAWCYVGLRVVHAAIHLGYNHPLHRLAAFAASLICILVMWLALWPFAGF